MAQAAVRRNLPGTRAEDFCAWEPQPLADMTSTLAAQQYLQQELARRPNAVQALLEVPPHTELAVWQYEHLRQIVLQTHHLIGLMGDGTCTAASCPEMAADNAKVRAPGRCSTKTLALPQAGSSCAVRTRSRRSAAPWITCATRWTSSPPLSQAASRRASTSRAPPLPPPCMPTLTRSTFPPTSHSPKLAAQFPSAVRRLYRVFLHAYHAHRGEYEQFEGALSVLALLALTTAVPQLPPACAAALAATLSSLAFSRRTH